MIRVRIIVPCNTFLLFKFRITNCNLCLITTVHFTRQEQPIHLSVNYEAYPITTELRFHLKITHIKKKKAQNEQLGVIKIYSRFSFKKLFDCNLDCNIKIFDVFAIIIEAASAAFD